MDTHRNATTSTDAQGSAGNINDYKGLRRSYRRSTLANHSGGTTVKREKLIAGWVAVERHMEAGRASWGVHAADAAVAVVADAEGFASRGEAVRYARLVAGNTIGGAA